jgi:hypothetical protein
MCFQRSRVLVLFTLSVVWALSGCSLIDLVSRPTPEPTFAPIIEVRPSLKFSPEKLPEAQVGQAYSAIITISDNVTPVYIATIEPGVLPPELKLLEVQKGSTVEISGIPKEAGEFTFTLSVGCYGTMVVGQDGQKVYTLVVKK